MTPGATITRLTRLIVETFPDAPVDQITPATHFADDLDADSLDTLQLVIAVEGEFNIDIPDAEYASVSTVEGAVALIDQLRQEAAPQ